MTKTFNPVAHKFASERRNATRAALNALRPLRDEVTAALKAAGFNRFKEGRSGRIAGICTITDDGWRSELVEWSAPHHVRIHAETRRGGNDEMLAAMCSALSAFNAEINAGHIEVMP